MDEPKPKKRKIGHPAAKGFSYEVKLTSLFICRGINSNYDFEIGTEIEEGDKFDDIIFKYVDKTSNSKFCILVQAKHSSKENDRIEMEHLLSDHSGGFGMCKYYFSYQKTKNNPFFEEHTIKYAIIVTNKRFDESKEVSPKNKHSSWEVLKNIENIVEEVPIDDQINLAHDESNGKVYRFKINVFLPALKNALVEYAIKMMAVELVDSLISKKNRTEDFIGKYYHMLVDEVIDPKLKQFRRDFIFDQKNDSVELNQFRNELKTYMKSKRLSLETILDDENKRFNFMNDYEICHGEEERRSFAKIIDDCDVEKFLKIFVIATGEPGENELDKLIEDELNEGFSNDQIAKILHVIMDNWTKGGNIVVSDLPADARFITSENIRELLTREDVKINEKLFQGHLASFNRIGDLNFDFDNSPIKIGLDKFLNSNLKVLDVSSKYKLLTCVKIFKYNENHCIIAKLSYLIDPTNDLIKFFVNKFCNHRLLVIECDVNKNCNRVSDRLINALSSDMNKKMIFVRFENNKFSSEFRLKFSSLNQFYECSDEEFNLDQLTMEKCSVEFQGFSVKLNKISNVDIEKTIIGDVSMKYLEGKEFKIGEPNKEMDKIQDYYIKRKFVTNISIDEKTTAFVLGIDDSSFCKEWEFAHIEHSLQHHNSRDEKSFIKMHKSNTLDNKTCILRKKQGNLYLLHKSSNSSLNYGEIEKKINETCIRRIALLSSNPGMGKTYVFNYLCHQTKMDNPDLWVNKIDLNSSSKFLKEVLQNDSNTSENNLMSFLNGALNIRSAERKLFQNFLKAGKVVLFFDGFDEISPTYKFVTIELIKTLNEYSNMNRIFISTRPHDDILDSINETFDVSSYELLPFSESDQIQFLRKFWQFNIGSDFDEDKFSSFENKLIRWFKKSFESSDDSSDESGDENSDESNVKNSDVGFLQIPLHTMMVATTLRKDFEAYINSELEMNDKTFLEKLSKSLNLSSLYENFIKIKCYEKFKIDIHSEISKFTFENFYEGLIRKYQLLSLKHLFGSFDLNSILNERERDVLISQNDIDRIGIMILKGTDYHFIHKTYAEYFSAMFIVNHINRESVVNFFLCEVLKEENKIVCSFVNEMLSDKKNMTSGVSGMSSLIENRFGENIHFAIRYSWLEIVKYLLENNVDLTHVNNNNENVFHLTCEHSNQRMLTMILEKIKNDSETFKDLLKTKNKISKKTPLLLIIRHGTLDNIKKVFETFKIDIFENEMQFVDEYNNNILHDVLWNQNVEVLKFIIANLQKRTEVLESLIMSKGSMDRSPLLCAAHFGNIDNIRYLFETMIDLNIFDAIKSSDRDNNNILHLAGENVNIEVLPFVVEQLKCQPETLQSLILSENKWGRSPLLCATRKGHIGNIRFLFEKLRELKILDKGIKSVDRDNNTILHLAAANDNVEVLRFVDEQLKQYPEIVKSLIQNKGFEGRLPLLCAARRDNIAKIRFFFDKLSEFNILDTVIKSVDKKKNTILHIAAVNVNVDVLRFIVERLKLQKGILNSLFLSEGVWGQTPLLYAAENGSVANIRFLFETLRKLRLFDSAILVRDSRGKNILELAVLNHDPGVSQYVKDELKDCSVFDS